MRHTGDARVPEALTDGVLPPSQETYGDITGRLLLREKLRCQSFNWYLKNIYPELHIPEDRAGWHGAVSLPHASCASRRTLPCAISVCSSKTGAERGDQLRMPGLQRSGAQRHGSPAFSLRLPRPGRQPGTKHVPRFQSETCGELRNHGRDDLPAFLVMVGWGVGGVRSEQVFADEIRAAIV